MIAFEATKNDVMKTWESKTAMCAARPITLEAVSKKFN